MTSLALPGESAGEQSVDGKRTGYMFLLKFLESQWCYQRTVVAEKNKYFSEIIASNCNNPRALFKTICCYVLEVPNSTGLDASPEICEQFLHFFHDKIESTRACISQPYNEPSVSLTCTSVFTHFMPVSLSILNYTLNHMKLSGSPADTPACLKKY